MIYKKKRNSSCRRLGLRRKKYFLNKYNYKHDKIMVDHAHKLRGKEALNLTRQCLRNFGKHEIIYEPMKRGAFLDRLTLTGRRCVRRLHCSSEGTQRLPC